MSSSAHSASFRMLRARSSFVIPRPLCILSFVIPSPLCILSFVIPSPLCIPPFVIPNHQGALFSKRARVCEGSPRKEQTPWRFLIAARGNDGRRRRRQQGGGSLFEGAAEDTEAEGVVKIQPLLPSAALAADTSLHEGGIIPSRLHRNDAGHRFPPTFCAFVRRLRGRGVDFFPTAPYNKDTLFLRRL